MDLVAKVLCTFNFSTQITGKHYYNLNPSLYIANNNLYLISVQNHPQNSRYCIVLVIAWRWGPRWWHMNRNNLRVMIS
jgi:hypothetical protein